MTLGGCKFVLPLCTITDVFVSISVDPTFVYKCWTFMAPFWCHLDSPDIRDSPDNLKCEPNLERDWDEETTIWGSLKILLHIFECTGSWGTGMLPVPHVWGDVLCVVRHSIIFFISKRWFLLLSLSGQPLGDTHSSLDLFDTLCSVVSKYRLSGPSFTGVTSMNCGAGA